MNAPLTNLYRQAEDYFFRGISSKCLDLDDSAHAYMTGGAEFEKTTLCLWDALVSLGF